MSNKKQLLLISIIIYILLLVFISFFKFFPTIINVTITNIFIFILTFILSLLLVYSSIRIKETKDIIYFLPQSLIYVFILRAIPNLRFSYPPLHDPYYYYISTLNILNYGTLKPILSWWYSGVDMQLHWPIIQLLTTILVHVTNVESMQFIRFQEPGISIISFMAMFILAKIITHKDGVAMLSAQLFSFYDIFYQSEYHPQGLAILIFMFLLHSFIKSRQNNNISNRYILLIFSTAFILTHHFTSLFLSLIFSIYMISILMIKFSSSFHYIIDNFYKIVEDLKSDESFIILIIVSSLAYHFLIYSSFSNQILILLQNENALHASLLSVGNPEIPLFYSIMSSSKWIVFILAILSIFWIIKTKNINEIRFAILFFTIILIGILGNFVVFSPLDRIIGFYYIFASIFACLTLYRFKDEWFGMFHQNLKVLFIILIVSIVMTSGFFISQSPAYFFKDSNADTFYWYSNLMPSMEEYKSTGEWVNRYTPNNSILGLEFDTRTMIPFFSKRPMDNIDYNSKTFGPNKYLDVDYVVINPSIPYKNIDKSRYETNLNSIYTNNEIKIYSRVI